MFHKLMITLMIIFYSTNVVAIDAETVRHVLVSAVITSGLYTLFTKQFGWESKTFSWVYAAAITFSLGVYYEAATNDTTTAEKDWKNNLIGIGMTLPIILW